MAPQEGSSPHSRPEGEKMRVLSAQTSRSSVMLYGSQWQKGMAMFFLTGITIHLTLVGEKNIEPTSSTKTRPNILFLSVDDMKDWVGCLDGYEGIVHTPHIDQLAKQGMLFSNAHCPSPKCAPSRAAIMTGKMPSTTGLYDNGHWWFPNHPATTTLPIHFKQSGYTVSGAGKVYHHTAGNNPPFQWDEYLRLTFRNDPWFRSNKLNYPWSETSPNPPAYPFSGVDGLGHENDWGSLGIAEPDYDDALTTDYAIDFLRKPHDKPFFFACGLFRPHLPWYVPQRFFDLYPTDSIILPQTLSNDLDDIPSEGIKLATARRKDFDKIKDAGHYKEAVRAYLASISYADHELGRILKALKTSPHAEQTITVLWSDHGWHLGEKSHWHKSTLWEEATRIPLIISAPGLPAGQCVKPVSLIHLFPTLIELTETSSVAELDGISLVPLLENATAKWNYPAITEYHAGNAAVRDERYRYIRYQDGGEELYDHTTDPHEWHNIASRPQSKPIIQKLSARLPKTWAKSAPTKRAFEFDPSNYSWKIKSTRKTISGTTKTR